jgi:hypothetical protein
MKKSILYLLVAVALIVTISCKKKKTTETPEAQLVLSTSAAAAVQNPGASYSFNGLITSAMPASGVKVDVTVAEEVSGAAVPQATGFNSSATTIPIQLTNLPIQKWCVVTVKVTSVTKPSNTAQATFRIVNK